MEKFIIARDQDGRLFRYPYEDGMSSLSIPCKHISGYPFDGNFYIEVNYSTKKGKEIESSLFPNVTYENSPVLFSSENPETPLMKRVFKIGGKLYSEDDFE